MLAQDKEMQHIRFRVVSEGLRISVPVSTTCRLHCHLSLPSIRNGKQAVSPCLPSQVWVLLVGEGHLCGVVHLLLVLGQESLVDLDGGWGQGGGSDEFLRRG